MSPGTFLNGDRYELRTVLGQGGFSITYGAHDRELNHEVAIKEFFPPLCKRQENGSLQPLTATPAQYRRALATVTREAHTLQRFEHVAIVKVFGVWEENNTAYMSMEWIHGCNLKELLDSHSGPLGQKESLSIIQRVGSALHAMHRIGILHHDLKPENIIVRPDGEAVLIDFGLAQAFDEYVGSTASVTHTRALIATPGYAALEQYSDQVQRGPYTDVYALAATLYHALSGQIPPSAGDRAAGVALTLLSDLNGNVSTALSTAVHSGMALAPTERPQDVAQWLKQLATATHEQHSTLPRPKKHGTAQMLEQLRPQEQCQRELNPQELNRQREALSSFQKSRLKRWPFSLVALLMVLLIWKSIIPESTLVPENTGPTVPQENGPRVPRYEPKEGDNSQTQRETERPPVPFIPTWSDKTETSLQTLKTDLTISLPLHPEPRFSRDGKNLVSREDTSGNLLLWNSETGRQTILVARGRKDERSGYTSENVCISSSGEFVAAVVDDDRVPGRPISRLELWDTRRLHRRYNLVLDKDNIYHLSFSPDNRWLVLGRWGETGKEDCVELRDAKTGALRRTFHAQSGESNISNVKGESTSLSLASTPDSRRLAMGCLNGVVKIWELSTDRVLTRLDSLAGAVQGLTFSPDQKLLAFRDRDGIKVIDWQRNRLLCALPSATLPLVFSPDNRKLATGSLKDDIEGAPHVWDVYTGTPLLRLVDNGSTIEISTLAFSPDGHTLYGTAYNMPIYIWRFSH